MKYIYDRSLLASILAFVALSAGHGCTCGKKQDSDALANEAKLGISQIYLNTYHDQGSRSPAVSVSEETTATGKTKKVSLTDNKLSSRSDEPRVSLEFFWVQNTAEGGMGEILTLGSAKTFDISKGQSYELIADGRPLWRTCKDLRVFDEDRQILEKTITEHYVLCGTDVSIVSIQALAKAKEILFRMSVKGQLITAGLSPLSIEKMKEFLHVVETLPAQ